MKSSQWRVVLLCQILTYILYASYHKTFNTFMWDGYSLLAFGMLELNFILTPILVNYLNGKEE